LGKALVIKEGVSELQNIPPTGAKTLRHAMSTFKLKDYVSPALLTVSTIYQGRDADNLREDLPRSDIKQIGKGYLNFYARYYRGVQQVRLPEVRDERVRNRLEVTERYEVKDLWKTDKAKRKWEATFYADSLEKMLPDPETRLRKMPLGLACPLSR